MHEFSYAERILKTVLQEAEKHGITRITTIRVVAGTLAHLKEPSVQMAFEAVSKGTPAQNAKVELSEVEGTEVRVQDFDGE